MKSARSKLQFPYCDWAGGAKQQAALIARTGKASLMLNNKQETLKT